MKRPVLRSREHSSHNDKPVTNPFSLKAVKSTLIKNKPVSKQMEAKKQDPPLSARKDTSRL